MCVCVWGREKKNFFFPFKVSLMAEQSGKPLTRVSVTSTNNVGVSPMSALLTQKEKFGDDVGGNPTTLTNGAPGSRPAWFNHAGGNAPSSGMIGAVPMPGASNAGPPGYASMAPSPDQPLEVMGWRTNPSAPYAKIARRLKHPLMEAPQKYQIMMTEREPKDPVLGRKAREARRYTMLNIPALNYYLANSYVMPNSEDEVLPATSVLNKWAFEGIVRTEEGKLEQYHWKTDVSSERLFNCVVRGQAHTFNVFGSDARPGTKLFLIIKKVKISKETVYTVKPYDKTSMTVGPKNPERYPLPFQVGFFGNYQYEVPPTKVLEYKDEFGNRAIGEYIYIGRVATHAPVSKNYKDVSKCARDLTAILAQPTFEIHVDY